MLFTEPLGTLIRWSYGYPWVTHNYSRVIHNYHKVKTTYFFVVRAVRRIVSGQLVGKIIIIIILSFRVGTSKNINIDHQVKETCAKVT